MASVLPCRISRHPAGWPCAAMSFFDWPPASAFYFLQGLNVSWRIFAPGVAKKKGIPSYNQSYTPKSPKTACCYEDNLANWWWTQWELGVPYYFQFHFGCKESIEELHMLPSIELCFGVQKIRNKKQTDQSGNTMEFPMLYPSHQWILF